MLLEAGTCCPLSYGMASPGCFVYLREGQRLCNIPISSFAGHSTKSLNSCRNVVCNKSAALVKLALGTQFLAPFRLP